MSLKDDDMISQDSTELSSEFDLNNDGDFYHSMVNDGETLMNVYPNIITNNEDIEGLSHNYDNAFIFDLSKSAKINNLISIEPNHLVNRDSALPKNNLPSLNEIEIFAHDDDKTIGNNSNVDGISIDETDSILTSVDSQDNVQNEHFVSSNNNLMMFAEEQHYSARHTIDSSSNIEAISSSGLDTIDGISEKDKIIKEVGLKQDCQTTTITKIDKVNKPKRQSRSKRKSFTSKQTKRDVTRKYACDWANCSYIARHLVHLKDHMRTHTGEKPYRCNWPDCCLSFTQASALKGHMRTHTGEKPFCCEWPGCSMRFSQKSNVKTHMKTHTGEKPYACDWPGCELRFSLKGNLDYHKKTHCGIKLFACDHPGCQRRYIHNSHLKVHKMIHQNDKPHACDWPGCSYRSVRHVDVVNHKLSHTGEKRFVCTICSKCFTRQNQLKRHKSQIHGTVHSNATQQTIQLNDTQHNTSAQSHTVPGDIES